MTFSGFTRRLAIVCALTFAVMIPVTAQTVGQYQQQYMQTLRSLSAAERQALDRKMAEALALYHAENYAAALPLFQEIAETADTLDVKFWSGISASRLGRYDLAKTKFEEMLELDPNLARVKLEYADVLEKMGRQQAARRELRSVLAISPPPSVERTIRRRLSRLESQSETTRTGFGVSVGYQFDDNISSGPDDDSIVIATGTLTLPATQVKQDGSNLLARANGNFVHDVGVSGNWLWAGDFFTYNSFNDEYSSLDYNLIDVSVGPVWASGQAVVRFPVGFKATWYGGDRLSDTASVKPGLKYVVSDSLSWDVTLTFANEEFQQARYTNTDNTLSRISIAPTFGIGERTSLSLAVEYEKRDADSPVFSYDGGAASFFLVSRLDDYTDAIFSYRYSQKDYDTPPPLFAANREDDRHSATAGLSRRFAENFVVGLNYTYMDNQSNADLYDFSRNLVSIELGYNL